MRPLHRPMKNTVRIHEPLRTFKNTRRTASALCLRSFFAATSFPPTRLPLPVLLFSSTSAFFVCKRHSNYTEVANYYVSRIDHESEPWDAMSNDKSSANAEEPCEHIVSWNRVECSTSVRRIAFKKACNLWMTFKVIRGEVTAVAAIW